MLAFPLSFVLFYFILFYCGWGWQISEPTVTPCWKFSSCLLSKREKFVNVPCQTVYELAEGVFFHTCLCFPHPPNCLRFKILTNSVLTRHFCDNYKSTITIKNSERCTQRKEADLGNRGVVSSKVKNCLLSPITSVKKIFNMRTDNKKKTCIFRVETRW